MKVTLTRHMEAEMTVDDFLVRKPQVIDCRHPHPEYNSHRRRHECAQCGCVRPMHSNHWEPKP